MVLPVLPHIRLLLYSTIKTLTLPPFNVVKHPSYNWTAGFRLCRQDGTEVVFSDTSSIAFPASPSTTIRNPERGHPDLCCRSATHFMRLLLLPHICIVYTIVIPLYPLASTMTDILLSSKSAIPNGGLVCALCSSG